MIISSFPNVRVAERSYVASVMLGEWLGLSSSIKTHEAAHVSLQLAGDEDQKVLILPDVFFRHAHKCWLDPASLPQQPLNRWLVENDLPEAVLTETDLPIIYGQPLANGRWFNQDNQAIELGLDIFGSAFFMLTRYEEIVKPERDQHDRFPAKVSLAYQEGFLERPIINEYLEVLWACLKRLWPGLQRKQRSFQVMVSHDVDMPLCASGQPFRNVARNVIGDLVKRRRPRLAVQRARAYLTGLFGKTGDDPCNTFDWLMALSEQNNIRSAFYFITGDSGGDIRRYTFDSQWIRHLLRTIYDRGHEIGLHPSYNTYDNPLQIGREFEMLRRVCNEENIKQGRWGGRQHFLRWEAPITWRHWEAAGIDYDSTLGFADHVGFRCGVCYPYQPFDILERRPLNLLEIPLIVMEGSLFGTNYMNVSYQDGGNRIAALIAATKKFDGVFTLLWHNSHLMTTQDRSCYKSSLELALIQSGILVHNSSLARSDSKNR